MVNHGRDMADILEMIFIHQLYQVDICKSITDIESTFFKKKPDVIVMGTGIVPNIAGVEELYKKIKKNKYIQSVPVIYLSADRHFVNEKSEHLFRIDPLDFSLLSRQIKNLFVQTA